MTREEREMSLADKRVKREMATEVLYVLPRLTPARYGEEYPKKIEVKVLNISKKQTLEDMVHFNDEGGIFVHFQIIADQCFCKA